MHFTDLKELDWFKNANIDWAKAARREWSPPFEPRKYENQNTEDKIQMVIDMVDGEQGVSTDCDHDLEGKILSVIFKIVFVFYNSSH